MKYPCRIGCSAGERAFPQTVEIDLECKVDVGRAAKSARVEDSVCWERADALLREICEQEWVLVEELAGRVCDEALERFPAAESVLVRIRKTPFPHASWVGVELKKKRQVR